MPLREHLLRQYAFFRDVVGRGGRDHVRILNADWNDSAISKSGVPPEVMIEGGGSVLNSAMAAWVLPVFAGLLDRLGEHATADEARSIAAELRVLVARTWNGAWFDRAYTPAGDPVGRDALWLEVQPWALLCGAATGSQARELLTRIDQMSRAASPLGARVKWPLPAGTRSLTPPGEGTFGGIWFAINMTLIWAAARYDEELAWDEWRRMSLAAHTEAHPAVWEGTLSGPDSWNAPEAARPGRTWQVALGLPGMQAFPISNMHAHAQPLLAYLRLLGVEPTDAGALRLGGGQGRFESAVLRLERDGTGSLDTLGPVRLETAGGGVEGQGHLRF